MRESYFLYNKSNLIEESFITEMNNLMSIYGSISYFSRKLDETAEIVSSSNPLNLMQKKKHHQKFSKLSGDKS